MIRLNEIYRSVQGEGPKVGLPTIFVRFAGCNLRCPGWPCDTPHAIFPKEYRHEWKRISVDELTEDIARKSARGENICYTGGEPFLQPHDELGQLTRNLLMLNRSVECFSNGTLPIPQWAFDRISFVFDWKLPGSGETTFNAETFDINLHRACGSLLHDKHALKFTVADRGDFEVAVSRWEMLSPEIQIQTFVSPVWGKVEPGDLVRWMLDADLVYWRLNLQTHKFIWDPDERKR